MTQKTQAARREAQRFFRFLVVGTVGFVVDTGLLSGFVFMAGIDRRTAKALAFCTAVITTFLLNRFWAYRESRAKSVLVQVTQFLLISAVGLGINVFVFGAADRVLLASLGAVVALYAAQVCAVGTALIWNFTANRFITYNDVKLGD